MAIVYGCVASLKHVGIIVDHAENVRYNYRAVVSSILPQIATIQASQKSAIYTHEQ